MKRTFLVTLALMVFGMTTMSQAASQPRKPAAAEEQRTTITDTVKKMRDDDDGVVVLFVKEKGSYYLRRDVAGFDGIRKKLETSLNEKKPVSVTAEATQLNILEVK
ncbi:MAG TPA: hypothetical protein VGE46_04085 [Bdellovibrio sp.]